MKTELLHTTKREELPAVIDVLHDRWFRACNASSVSSGTCCILFWENLEDIERFPPTHALVIESVVEVIFNDTELVEFYDLNEIVMSNGRLVLSTGVPLKCEYKVHDLDLRVFMLEENG